MLFYDKLPLREEPWRWEISPKDPVTCSTATKYHRHAYPRANRSRPSAGMNWAAPDAMPIDRHGQGPGR